MRYDSRGVGLRVEGLPTDLKKFYWVLAEQGCHPKAADRIISRINNKGYDLLTVQSDLNFKWIKDELEVLGVKMSFTEPLEDWYEKYDDGPWPPEALPERFRRFGRLAHGG